VCARNYNFNLWREITIIVASISEIDRLWTWGNAVHLMTTNRPFGRSQGLWWSWLFLWCA
jgi:hypothetical protein